MFGVWVIKNERLTAYVTLPLCFVCYMDQFNTLALVRNVRTSVEMIDHFYAKPLSCEMNMEMLQSKRCKRDIVDGETIRKN